MRRLTSYIPLVALALLAAWPLILYGPPLQAEAITDGPNHLYRFVELARHVRHGDFYPRWFSDLHFGFGAPVLNFYAPLSYYILLGLSVFSSSAPATFLLGFLLAFIVAVMGMYHWASEQFESPPAGLVAAMGYSTTPYVYYSLMERAAYPELWGMALAPWVFWLALRLILRPSRKVRLAFILLYAAFILTHNLSALLLTPLLGLYTLLLALETKNASGKTFGLIGASILHSLALAAFFLLPFFAESSNVQLERTRAYNYVASFVTAAEILSPPVPFDPYHVLNSRPISAPWPALLLALIALAAAFFFKRQARRITTVVFSGTMLTLLWLATPSSAPFWGRPPFSLAAPFIQFPFRWFAPAMLLLAWLTGAGIACLPKGKWQSYSAVIAVVSCFLFSLAWTYHTPFSRFPDVIQPADIIRDEIAHPQRIGTTNLQEFLPRSVSELPPPETMLPRYADGGLPSRLASLPEGATLLEERLEITAAELIYDAPESFTATFNIFDFPGWVAWVDGESVKIQPSQPHGLITVGGLPAGRHILRVALQPTLPQTIGTLISMVALGMLFVYRPAPPNASGASATLSPAYALIFIALITARLLVFDRLETPFNYSARDHIAQPLAVNFGDQLELMGFDYPQGGQFVSGQSLPITLYWRALMPLRTDYQITIQLADRFGNRFGQSDNPHPGGAPTSQWKPEQYARDQHFVPAISGTPPGSYRLLISAYAIRDGVPGAPLTIQTDQNASALEYEIGPVMVSRPRPQPPGSLRLVESSLAVSTVGVGDQIPFTLVWESGGQPLPVLTVVVSLMDADGRTLFSTDLPPAGPDYTTDQWMPNERILYPHSITLPPDLPAGSTQVTVSLARADGTLAAGSFALGSVTITTPERTFVIPPMAHRVEHDFNSAIRLLGYNLAPDSIILYWQAHQPIPQRWVVFVHRFDANGVFTGGHDRPPTRTTTSWLPGEVITDVHPIPVGDGHFEIGLYNATTQERAGESLTVAP